MTVTKQPNKKAKQTIRNNPWQQWRTLLLTALVVALLSEMVRINPFGGTFRFSLGVAAFTFAALFWTDVSLLPVAMASGVATILVRSVLELNLHAPLPAIQRVILINWPSAAYYILVATILHYSAVRKHFAKPFYVVAWIWVSDFIPNILELIMRRELLLDDSLLSMLGILAMVALFRTSMVGGLYYMIRRQQEEQLSRQERAKYEELLLLLTGLYTEAFFLRKSSGDIESTMAKGYALYRDLKQLAPQIGSGGNRLAQQALDVAKDIHEIKKDYQRIISGIDKLIEVGDQGEVIALDELIKIVIATNTSYATKQSKTIHFETELDYRFRTAQYHSLISVLNNLVSNAVEAIDREGTITIKSYLIGWHIFILVHDTGEGIPEPDQQIIFAPGYTTKFAGSGLQSTGIGLTHVQSIVKSLGGEVRLTSRHGDTTFTLILPRSRLEWREADGEAANPKAIT